MFWANFNPRDVLKKYLKDLGNEVAFWNELFIVLQKGFLGAERSSELLRNSHLMPNNAGK